MDRKTRDGPVGRRRATASREHHAFTPGPGRIWGVPERWPRAALELPLTAGKGRQRRKREPGAALNGGKAGLSFVRRGEVASYDHKGQDSGGAGG